MSEGQFALEDLVMEATPSDSVQVDDPSGLYTFDEDGNSVLVESVYELAIQRMMENADSDTEGTELLKSVSDIDERLKALQESEDRHMKWRVMDDGLFTAVGHTTRTIPAGVYDIVVDGRGNVYFQRLEARADNIIRFPNSPIDEVVAEIESFWAREARFKLYGLPFKRGILLHGPPGSGKSCTLQLVAREMVARGGYVVQFHDVDRFLSGYRMLRQVQPTAPMVVLMEDLDEILKGKSSAGESRILNLLDGIEATHNVVFLATTNYPQNLGDRIANRPSRFDHRIYVAHPGESERRQYLASLINKNDNEMIDLERLVTATDGLSLAHAKELFVATHILGENFDACAKRLARMRQKPTSVDDGDDFIPSKGLYV